VKLSMPALTLLFVFILSVSGSLWAQKSQEEQKAREIVKKIDELFRSNSSYSEMEMDIVTTHWQRTLKMKIWTSGKHKTFIRILEPLKERGIGTLRIKNEMWNYLPKTNKVIKVPPSMMMSSWMGSDFNNDDLVDEFSLEDDYNYTIIHPEDAREDLIYLQFIPHEGLPIVWGKIVSSVRKSDYMPVQDQYFDENGSLMRIMNYKDVKVFDNRKIPSVIELIPQKKEGNKTVLRYLTSSFNINLGEDIFTLRNLRTPEF
jgi:outer membrane lipoprotein-sorting protein